jgi:hypothetical protein
LKKPFVPPDPLISMVKSALVRAGVAHAGFTPPKPAAEEVPVAAVPVAPKISAPVMEVPKGVAPEDMESFVDEVPAKPVEFKIESGTQPVAFGNLLETAGTTTEEDAPELAPAPAGLRMERDFGAGLPKEAEEEEEEAGGKASWRRDAAEGEPADDDAAAVTSRDFRSGGRHESWTPTREKEDLSESVETLEPASAGMMDRRDMPPGPPFAGEAWAAAIDNGSSRKTAVAEEEHPTVDTADLEKMIGHAPEPVAESQAEPSFVTETPPFVAHEQRAEPVSEPQQTADPSRISEANSWFSTPPPNPWEAEAQKVSQLASTWHSTVPAPVNDSGPRGDVSFDSTSGPDEIEVVSGVNSEVAVAAAETVREQASQVAEQVERQAEAAAGSPAAREAIHDAAAHLDMDSVVAKVLSRLSPGLLSDATREILKPVVEAVVREELNSRKQ